MGEMRKMAANQLCRTPHGVRGLKYARAVQSPVLVGRTPHGVRGLKYSVHAAAGAERQVAPLTGCVD